MLVQPKRSFLQAGLVAYEKEGSKYISRFGLPQPSAKDRRQRY